MAKRRNAGADSSMDDPRTSPVPLAGGMWTSGDPTTIPDGYTLLTRNMVIRPNRICARPPFVYDGLTAVNGFMIWEDLTNQQTRFLALTTNGNLYMKAASGETWSAPITTGLAAGLRLTDYANYRGKLYFMLDDGAGNPTAAAMFDGTTVTVTPFNSAIFARTITTFIDRLFLSYPRVTVTPSKSSVLLIPALYALNSSPWSLVNITAATIAVGGGTVVRLMPTSTTASQFRWSGFVFPFKGPVIVSANATPTTMVWRSDLRNLSATYEMPVTLELQLSTIWNAVQAYVVGDTVSDGTYIHRCSVAGISGGAAPAWNVVLGGATADNTVTWTNEGSNVIGSTETLLPVGSESSDFTTVSVRGVLRAATNTNSVTVACKFFSTSVPTITLIPVDVSFRDGLTDGDPRKANKGQQVTIGDFNFPFCNVELATSATVNLETIIWSETTNPKAVRAANTYEPKESAGLPTAAVVASGRYIDFKRRAFWVFTGTADADIPILPESPATIGVGCLGPRAITRLRDELFFIGETEIYRMRVGGYPQPICGDAMRETIMSQGSNWVESQATANMPLIAVDEQRHELWVYTQKGTLFCYHMAPSTAASAPAALYSSSESGAGAWSQHDVNAAEVTAMTYNPTTKKMQFAFLNHGAARFDDTTVAQDTINAAGTLYPVTKEITVKPFELTGPRSELCLHDIGLYQLSTAAQTAELLYIYISFDRGKTFTKYNEVRFDPTTTRIPVPVFQSGVSVTIKITAVGQAGEAIFSLSHADATLELLAGEWPLTNPTQIGNTLTP